MTQKGFARWHGDGAAHRAVTNNRTRLLSGVAKEAFKLRAEIVERSFAHNLDRGGMRRTWLRGRENVHKRYLLHVAGHNLSLLMRKLIGAGTPQEAVAGGYGCICVLRVRPETLCRITEFSEHESNGRELDEGERVAVEVLPVLGQSAAAVEPGDGAFDHPTPGLDDEALHPIGSLDDLGLEIGQDAGQGAVKDRPLIGAAGEQFPEKGKQTEQGRQQRETAVAILNVGGGDDAVQQQALRIDQNMPLLALDQLAGIEAVAVDASPPFSALFTL